MVEAPTAEVATFNDRLLMAQVCARWAIMIEAVSQSSSIPPAFLAGLIANESGGETRTVRFEPGVYARLIALKARQLAPCIPFSAAALERVDEDELCLLATSFGLTQIIGNEAMAEGYAPFRLLDPELNLKFASALLAGICEHSWLDPRTDFGLIFRCWNERGLRQGTFDPKWVEDGIRRMEIYGQTMKERAWDSCLSASGSLVPAAQEDSWAKPEASGISDFGILHDGGDLTVSTTFRLDSRQSTKGAQTSDLLRFLRLRRSRS